MKFKFTWGRKLIAGILLATVVVGGTAAPAEAASKNHTAVVAQDHCVRDFWERVMAAWLMESAVTAVDTHGQP